MSRPEGHFAAFDTQVWGTGQDQCATIKRNLCLLLPGASVFLDVDDLKSIDALEEYAAADASSPAASLPPPASRLQLLLTPQPPTSNLLPPALQPPASAAFGRYIDQSQVIMFFVSKGYFVSRNCLREVDATMDMGKPITLVHDPVRAITRTKPALAPSPFR